MEMNAVGDMDYLQMIDMWQDKHQLDPSMEARNLIMAPNSQVSHLTIYHDKAHGISQQKSPQWKTGTHDRRNTTQHSQIPNTTNQPLTTQIRVIVRKRPLNKKEINKCYDIASCLCAKNGQKVVIHEPKASEWWCPCWCVCACVCVCVFV